MNLEFLNSISFLLPYSSFHSKLLNRAKNQNCTGAIKAFESLFEYNLLQNLNATIANKCIKTVITAPASFHRLQSAVWHPCSFISKVLTLNFHGLNVIHGVTLDSHRESLQTNRSDGKTKVRKIKWSQQIKFEDPILIVDDVLTAGNTVRNIYANLSKQKKPHQLLDLNLMVLFRAPQGTSAPMISLPDQSVHEWVL